MRWSRFTGPPWVAWLGAIAALVLGAWVLLDDRLVRARARREGLRRCGEAKVDRSRCQAGVRAHHTSCFNLTNDAGSKYRRGTGMAWNEYLLCAVEGPEAYRRGYSERIQRARATQKSEGGLTP